MNLILTNQKDEDLAELVVEMDSKGRMLGKITTENFPKNLRRLFQKFETLVNQQIFSLIDEVEDEIQSEKLRIKNKDWKIYDIQVFNNTDISFRVR